MIGHLRYFSFRRNYRLLYGSWFNRKRPESSVSEYAVSEYAGWKYRTLEHNIEKHKKKKEAYLGFLNMVEPRDAPRVQVGKEHLRKSPRLSVCGGAASKKKGRN